jgi:predicted Fe-S protein YdhL (DUF1289 family)
MESPCVKICTYDPARGVCLGCGRTLEEISAWSSMTQSERRVATAKAQERLRQTSSPAS